MDFKIGQTVYHRDVYEHREALTIVGIREDELELEGDYSGGTHGVKQKQWMPLKGTSRIYNHGYKLKCRNDAVCIQTLAIPCAGCTDNTYVAMMDMVHAVMVLTSDVSLNPEF
jgi:hypothetical protein